MRYVALLRGINVGGKHSLPMKELAAQLEGLGCARVRTYIQSGNAVFEAPARAAGKLPGLLQAAILKQKGFDAPVVLRSSDELGSVLRSNPFLKQGAKPDHCYVGFLARLPGPAALKDLDPQRSPGHAYRVQGREVFLHLPTGVATTKLTNTYFDQTLKTVCTMRNWRTVLALDAMARDGKA
jgi:uncharacterized protein (DUF1697 family)